MAGHVDCVACYEAEAALSHCDVRIQRALDRERNAADKIVLAAATATASDERMETAGVAAAELQNEADEAVAAAAN